RKHGAVARSRVIAVAMRDHGAVNRAMRIDVEIAWLAIESGFGRVEPGIDGGCQRGHRLLTRKVRKRSCEPVPQCRSGNDIGKQLVLDLRNAIFQGEFFLFKPLDEKLVSRRVGFKSHDLAIELAMLRPQAHQFVSELALVAPFHRNAYPTARPSDRSIAAF